MQFLTLVKTVEGGGPPPQSFLDAMNRARDEAVKSGKVIDTGGLAPTAMSSCVRLAGGQVRVIDGPYAESKEVVGGFAFLELPSREAAVESATWLMEMHKQHWPGWEGEVEVRQIFRIEDGDALRAS